MIQILIKPTFENLREDFDGSEEDEEALLFEQGFEEDCLEVEDGETFEIPAGYEGELLLEENEQLEVHQIIQGVDMGLQMGSEVENEDVLEEGKYELEGKVLRRILSKK